MSKSRFVKIAIAATFGMLLLAACGLYQTRLDTIVGAEQTDRTESPNAAALHDAEKGMLQQPAFVEFYSVDCDTCRRIQGPMRILDAEYDNRIKFIYVDIDLPEYQPFVRGFNVRGVPMFVLLNRRGEKVATLPGWPGEEAVAASLDRLLAQR